MEPVVLDAGSRYIMPQIFVPAEPLWCYSNPTFVPFPNCIVKSDDRCLFELLTFGIDMCHLNWPLCKLHQLTTLFATSSVWFALWKMDKSIEDINKSKSWQNFPKDHICQHFSVDWVGICDMFSRLIGSSNEKVKFVESDGFKSMFTFGTRGLQPYPEK